jgi:hypothetical protein
VFEFLEIFKPSLEVISEHQLTALFFDQRLKLMADVALRGEIGIVELLQFGDFLVVLEFHELRC